MQKRQVIGLVLGPLLFSLFYFVPDITGLDDSPRAVLAVTAWVASWWVTEALPIPATSLLPIILLPLTGGTDEETATMAYGDPIVFMYMGGFTIALAIERWNLHKRIAMTIIAMIGTSGQRIILGVAVSTALLSMWISNAATALMMLPIALALINEVKDKNFFDERSLNSFAKGLLLTVAYSASIGGLATLIGSVPNAAFAAVANNMLDTTVTFADWFLFGFPVTVILITVLFFYITRIQFKVTQSGEISEDFARNQLNELGPMSYEEKAVLAIFSVTGFLWLSTGFIPEDWQEVLNISDTSISIFGALAMFLVPSRQEQGGLMTWKNMKELPWGLLVLFGGGLSLAAAFEDSGLTEWFGDLLEAVEVLPYVLILIVLAAAILFMTEILSNTALANMMMPISIGLALGIGVDPYSIMAIVALTASCAFMLPIATPPNAAVFSSDYLQMDDMVKAGFWMNIIAIIVIVVFVYFWQPIVLSF
ncbi:sodium-dependent dicarboxylate transporter 2/3/5 [Geomicrobium halophilum]|uniref:Sodium-dependent dicarboxylate transporter SdcS n=1 Tax=Geomicrobium halophilum TaxID=549000 RepID=A0A841PZQ8_9BACL|nr:SLC13 family permease [Geomicrobium halophilum]MBB6450543.1 sodium-dependent dicarboxylate transporter 2/3/5 [Geomicrobium halophilum]